MKILSALLTAAVAWPLATAHAAVNPNIISADARWVIHADLNALRGTPMGKELVAAAQEAKFDTGQGKIGVDLPKVLATVGSLTAYGSNFSKDPNAIDGALVAQGTPDLRKILESILLQATIADPNSASEVNDLPFPTYWVKHKDAPSSAGEAVYIAFPPEGIVVVSKSKPQLLKARDAFGGHAPTVAKVPGAPLRQLIDTAGNAFLFAASVVPSDNLFPEDQPQARVLKMTNRGAIAIGERGPNTYAHAELIATSDQMADKLMKILQGMTAMLSLAETNDKQLADFLNSVNVTRNDQVVTLDLAYASDRLAQMIHTLRDRERRTPEEVAAARSAQIINGKAVDEWQAKASGTGADAPAVAETRTIQKVELKNGTIVTFGNLNNGGRDARFDHIEITPADGTGAPLTFRPEFMRTTGPRGSQHQLQFPGVDGTYTLRVTYINDPTGKATYAVSIRQPKLAAPTEESKPAAPAENAQPSVKSDGTSK